MAIVFEKNSINYVTKYPPMRCDTHFKYNIKLTEEFFSNKNVEWVTLGSVLENVRNGMNVSTEHYSMIETNNYYISVSQIKEYGLIDKNQNFLQESVKDLNSYYELNPNTLLVTRSGTIGVALSTSHPSFNFDENNYIASGFVITAGVIENVSSTILANYINIFDVQRYLIAMSAGACQKNISQPIICNLPIPSIMLKPTKEIENYFKEYETECISILSNIENLERRLVELKGDISSSIKNEIFLNR